MAVWHHALREEVTDGLAQAGDAAGVDDLTLCEPAVAAPAFRAELGNPREKEKAKEGAP